MSEFKFLSSESFYDEISKYYQNISNKRRNYNEAVDTCLKKHPHFLKFQNVLDIGSGDGIRITKLFASKARIFVLEESAQMCKTLRQNEFIDTVLEGNVESVDLRALRGRFDLVVMQWNVLGHVENHRALLDFAFAALSPEGHLIFDVNNPFNISQYGISSFLRNLVYFCLFPRKDRKFFNHQMGTSYTRVSFSTPGYYERLLKSCGFDQVNRTFINYETGKSSGYVSGQVIFDASKKTMTKLR